jgi:hypothetical protein
VIAVRRRFGYSRAMRRVPVFALILAAGLSVGCGSNQLETGYAYTPLGSSPAVRRGFYADPFSPEAREAQQEQTVIEGRRAVPGE